MGGSPYPPFLLSPISPHLHPSSALPPFPQCSFSYFPIPSSASFSLISSPSFLPFTPFLPGYFPLSLLLSLYSTPPLLTPPPPSLFSSLFP